MMISHETYQSNKEAQFSILIPTWNNLPYLKLCVESIRKHSTFSHEIILHINDGSDGSLEWARSQEITHSYSAQNVGVCHALNAAASLATTDYIAFCNDDMYVLPAWDKPLINEIRGLNHNQFFLSATMIEPRSSNNNCVLSPHDYGQTVDTFREEDLLNDEPLLHRQDWNGSTWPPNVVHRSVWEAVGGYSIEFSPGIGSDPDFSMKIWNLGVRHFKGLGESKVYHFQTKSTEKVKKNPGSKQFLEKWGITQGTFSRYYLRRGKPWKGPLKAPGPVLSLRFSIFKSKIKARLKAWGFI